MLLGIPDSSLRFPLVGHGIEPEAEFKAEKPEEALAEMEFAGLDVTGLGDLD